MKVKVSNPMVKAMKKTMPKYITTRDLVNAYNTCDGSYYGFIESLKNECEV